MSELETSTFPSFPAAEYERRVERARALMAAAGLDVLLVTAEANFRYFTGFVLQTMLTQARPRFFILPREGEPCAIVARTYVFGMQRSTWLRDIRDWVAPCPEDEGVSLVADALSAFAGPAGTVGAELGIESWLSMPVQDFLRLREMVDPVRIVDGSRVLHDARMVKSPAEVERLRRICQIASDAFEALPQHLRMGDTEWTACRKFQIEAIMRGAQRTTWITGVSGRGGYDNPNSGPMDRVLGPGDILFIDTGCHYDYYWCDFDRHYAFGPPSDAVRTAYDAAYRATDVGIAAVRPGRRARDIWRDMAESLQAEGDPGGRVGRMGHGLGLFAPEPPSINATDETVIEPGMVLTIEPSLNYTAPDADVPTPKIMVHEENVVVTEDGCEVLTKRAPPEIPVIE